MSNIRELYQLGQSCWLDNLTRQMINSGELERKIDKDGITGITSNPKTFADSLLNSDLYDSDIRRMKQEGASTVKVYEQLMVDDVQRACDLLQKVYSQSEGKDGFVSIEVDPRLARQTDETLRAVRHIHELVDRPNCMVKIPGTQEGLPAIESALTEGIPINITLLFSHGRYKQVLSAYLRAMHRRREKSKDINIPSVASFFLSRIDSLVDELLDHRIPPNGGVHLAEALKGKMALAEARLAFRAFCNSQDGNLWKQLNGRPQRLLWASTSTKNPHYSPTLYIDHLIAPNTVNTMPEKTIKVFQESGKVQQNTIEQYSDPPEQILQSISNLAIDLNYIEQRLEDEAIQKFINALLQGLKITESK